jgi:hypothetical protein
MRDLTVRFQGKFFTLFFMAVLLFSLSFGYIQAEYLTGKYKGELKAESFCQNFEFNNPSQINFELKFFKITALDETRGKATIYCFYSEANFNVMLELEKGNQWRIVFSKLLNKEGGIYWPFYIS